MTGRYESLGAERFSVEQTAEGELIRIRARRQIFPMLFLPIWIVGWTIGGVFAMMTLLTDFQLFLVVWLCGWAVGWCAAAGSLVWMITGSETLRVTGGDLEIAHHVFGASRRWLYQGSQLRGLDVAGQGAFPFQFQFQIPFFRTKQGTLKFDYGARTYYAAAGLDEAEARLIVDRLAKSLPTTARNR